MDEYSTLSTFHMPHSVELTREPDNACVISFDYPNDEPAERESRYFSDLDPNVSYSLGRHSRKLLCLRIANPERDTALSKAVEGLAAAVAATLRTAADRWLGDAPADNAFAARRNVEVIEKILHAIPLDLWRDLFAATGEFPRQRENPASPSAIAKGGERR